MDNQPKQQTGTFPQFQSYPVHALGIVPGGGAVLQIFRSQLERTEYLIPEEQFATAVKEWNEMRRRERAGKLDIARVIPPDLKMVNGR